MVETRRALEACEWEGSPPPLWARRGVGDMDSLVREDVGCPSRRELRLPEPTLASLCAPRHAVGLQRVSCVCVCAAGAVSGDKIPIVAKKKQALF